MVRIGVTTYVVTAFLCIFCRRSSRTTIVSSYTASFVPQRRTHSISLTNIGTCRVDDSSSNSRRRRRQSDHRKMIMFAETSGGIEQLQEYIELSDTSNNVITKQIRKSPSLFKMVGIATIPISVLAGFAMVPSRRLAAHAVGAIITGIAGIVGKSKMDSVTQNYAKPALVQTLIDYGLDSIDTTSNAIQSIQEQFGLLDDDFEAICTEVYSQYLMGMVKFNPTAKTSELKELEQLKQVLALDNLQVGEAHMQAAAEWYRTTCLFTPEEELHSDPTHPDRQAMDKLLFLSERAFHQNGETKEAFVFEMTRVARAVKLDYHVALERVATTAEPFYTRALKSTRSKLTTNQVSSDMLERARHSLGIDDDTAFDMHIASFNEEVRSLLGLKQKSTDADADDDGNEEEEDDDDDDEESVALHQHDVKFTEGAIERLELLKEVLELSDTDAQYEIAVEVTPLYQATALAAMKDVLSKTKTPDDAWDIMEARRVDLGLKEGSSKELLRSMIMQALGGPLEQTNKFAKVNNEAATYDNLLEALEAKKALISILKKSGWEEFDKFDETFCNPWDKKSANGFLLSEERIKIYRIFLNRSIYKSVNGKLDDDTYNRIMEVKGLLGITDIQAEIESRGAFGKKLQKVLSSAMTEIIEDYTPELAENMQREVNDILEGYRLTEDYLRESGASFYTRAVQLVSEKSPAGIPEKEMSNALNAFRTLCKLSVEETYPSHMEYFGSVYKKSVLEAMGQTGVIRPELRDALDDLRDRLGVSEANTKKLFLDAIKDKITPMVEWIGSELERTMLTQQQLSKRRGKDMGEDMFQTGKGATGVLGLGAEVNLMSDIMELIDFYTENNLIDESEGEKTYPITALGLGAVDQEVAELLYRQFIVGGFQAQGPNASRYESSRETFAGILGLSEAKIEEIGKTIGSTVYDNFVTNAMQTKGSLDQQDMMFLANIQGKLGLTSEQGEKMLLASQKKILSEEIEAIMDQPSAETIKSFREKCNTMGLDLMQDVGISRQRLLRMFECEVVPGLKSGTITANDSDLLGEIQESIGIDPDECETMFENVLNTLSKNAYSVIKGEILRGREDNTVELINELVRYAAFTDGDLGLEVDEAMGHKVMNIYDAFDFDGEDEERIKSNKLLLKEAMGLALKV